MLIYWGRLSLSGSQDLISALIIGAILYDSCWILFICYADLQILREKKPHPKDTQRCSVLSRQAYRCKVLQCLLSLRLKRRTRWQCSLPLCIVMRSLEPLNVLYSPLEIPLRADDVGFRSCQTGGESQFWHSALVSTLPSKTGRSKSGGAGNVLSHWDTDLPGMFLITYRFHGDLQYIFSCNFWLWKQEAPDLTREVPIHPTNTWLPKFAQKSGRGLVLDGNLATNWWWWWWWWWRRQALWNLTFFWYLLNQMKGSVLSVNRGVAVLSTPQVWNCRVQHISQPPSADQKLCNNRNPENQTSSASAKRNVWLPSLWPKRKEWNV